MSNTTASRVFITSGGGRRAGPAIHAVYRNSGDCVHRVSDAGGVERAGHAMLRAEDRLQRDSRGFRQYIYRPLTLPVDARLIGYDANSLSPGRRLQHIKSVLLKHINPGLHGPVP